MKHKRIIPQTNIRYETFPALLPNKKQHIFLCFEDKVLRYVFKS